MIVGVTMRYVLTKHEKRDCVSHDWFNFFKSINVKLVLIPNNLKDPVDYIKSLGVNRLLLTGGESIGDFSIKKNLSNKKSDRDLTEEKLLDWSVKSNLSVFGVCRGMQIINAFFGGKITRNLNKEINDENHVACKHKILIKNGREIVVNSFHDEGIKHSQVSHNLKVFATSPKGIVEGLKHPKKDIVGIQWHPERKWSDKKYDLFLIKKWLKNK